MEESEMDEIPPEVIHLTNNTEKITNKFSVSFDENFSFNTLHPNFSTDENGNLFYNEDTLVINKSELKRIYQTNKDKEIKTFPQTLKLCKACHCYYYNNNSHRDEKHRINSKYLCDLSHMKKKLTTDVKLEVLHPITNHTEYAYYQENKLIIHSEGKEPRQVRMKLKNCTSKTIGINKAIADNSRNGYIHWAGGLQQANLQIYEFNEEIAPETTSTQTILINLPGEIEASKDLTIKIKTMSNEFHDLDIVVFNNYLENDTEIQLEKRLNSQWKYEKDKENFKEDLNTKESYRPINNLFESLSIYTTLQNRYKDMSNKPLHLILSNLPTDIRRIVQILSEDVTRENYRERFTHFIKIELVHYLSELGTIKTVIVTISIVGLKTNLTLDLSLQSLNQLNIKMNEIILIKTNNEIYEGRVTLSEIHQTTVEVNAILNLSPKTSVQITSPIRITPFTHMMSAIEATKDLSVGLATKNYMFPNVIRTKPCNVQVKVEDTTLDECQVEAVNKIANLAPGDVFTLQGPPGTGKSRTIVEVINQACKRGESTLLVCQTNLSTCDMFGRLKKSLKDVKITKILSTSAKVEKVCERFCSENLRDGDMRHALPKSEDVYNSQIVICTTTNSHRINNLKGFNDQTSEGFNKTFQNILIDEAAYASEPNLMIPIVRNITGGESNFKLILVGDPLQLNQNPRSAIFRDIKQTDIMTRVNVFLKKYSTNHHTLTNNYRNSVVICDLLNKLFYNDKLICKNQERGTITLVHAETSKSAMNSQSKVSTPEASATMRFVKLRGNENFKILSYYSAQRVKIMEQAKKQSCRNINVTTVEAVQGLEGENIIINTTIPALNNPWQCSEKRLNVIISRSQKNLIVVGNIMDLCSHSLYKKIVEVSNEIYAPDSIKKMLVYNNFDKKYKAKKKKKGNIKVIL